MSSATNTDVSDVANGNGNGNVAKDVELQVHTEEGSPWPNISPEFDAQMMEHIRQPFDVNSDKVKIKQLDENGNVVVAPAASYNFVRFSDLRDTKNRPILWDTRYNFREGNVPDSAKRMVDYENGNKKRVVFNSKWNDGLHLKFDNHMLSGNKPNANVFGIRYPGGSDWRGSDWLLGMKSGSDDVTLGKNQLSSQWMFESAGTDNTGQKHYKIYSQLSSATDYGGIWLPGYGVGRAGYDNDHEWRTYEYRTAPQGFFTVKFERVD
ncbi:uncharacterized protein PpBr36_10259 [Pyricularia pennisetigena]|uniref:uncharacterized protein n=1 Tax=Pyricularia pennisetigena TaxID=1578925 RepID=UPI00114D9316|nr:uncharacterized protein PpBr36_10259 [Pyricularia pennisetigena]TLS21537.1 hypothetical protein PpBr36_10259 [Pyricularia pennisetigena]